MLPHAQLEKLQELAREIRKKTIYEIANLGVGHIGGALSIVEILALLYGQEMNVRPEEPRWNDRDMLVLSKGHAGPALYATLAIRGFFPETWLDTLNQGGTSLPSHCDRTKTPGIDMSTGSLGQGLSAACGMAYAQKIDGNPCYIYVIIGDGESQEGQNWEAAMFAAQYKLGHLIAFTDYNKLQIDGTVDEIMSLGDVCAKWEAFGWHVQRVDGHDFQLMHEAIQQAKQQQERPSMIVLDTVKGKGAAFCEGMVGNHNMKVDMTMATQAISELNA